MVAVSMLESETWRTLARPELISRATELGVERAERMTRLELVDEILRLTKVGAEELQARGLFGVARVMLANMMESGLNLPDAAALIRGTAHFGARLEPRASVATVTLAEIYAAQGHRERALAVLDKVLVDEPEHSEALRVKREILETAAPPAALVRSGDLPVSTEYEHPSALETTGVEVRTGEPPPVTPIPPAPDSSAPPLSQAPSLAEDPLSPQADLLAPEPPLVPEAVAVTPLPAVEAIATEPPQLTPRGTVRSSELGLSWSGPILLIDWTLSDQAPAGDAYCVRLVAFERSLGLPIRRELWVPLPEAQPGASGQLRFSDFIHASVSAALGIVGEGEAFFPIAPSAMIQALPG